MIEEDLRDGGEGSTQESQQQFESIAIISQDVRYTSMLDIMIQWLMHFQL